MILDIHSHRRPPYPEGLISLRDAEATEVAEFPAQLFSIGFHPWDIRPGFPSEENLERLSKASEHPNAAAIGECGIDLVKGGMLFLQRKAFASQAAIAEELGKPLVIHCVKAHDHIIAFHQDLRPTVNWAIHGFRGKATVGRMLTDEGLWLSFGSRFNPETLLDVPLDRLLAETDEEQTDIMAVIAGLEKIRPEITPELIAANTAQFLSGQ